MLRALRSRELFCPFGAQGHQFETAIRSSVQRAHRVGQAVGVLGSGVILRGVATHFRRSGHASGQNGYATCHCFKWRQPEAFRKRRKDEQMGTPINRDEFVIWNFSEESYRVGKVKLAHESSQFIDRATN